MSEKMPRSTREIAEIEKSRTISDAGFLDGSHPDFKVRHGVAAYRIDENGEKQGLDISGQQMDYAKGLMESDLYMAEQLKKIERVKEIIKTRGLLEPGSTKYVTLELANGEKKNTVFVKMDENGYVDFGGGGLQHESIPSSYIIDIRNGWDHS